MSGSPLKKFSQKSFSISSAYLITLNLVTWPPLVKGGLRDAMFILGILPPLNNRDIPLIRSGECVMGRQISLTQQFHTEREREPSNTSHSRAQRQWTTQNHADPHLVTQRGSDPTRADVWPPMLSFPDISELPFQRTGLDPEGDCVAQERWEAEQTKDQIDIKGLSCPSMMLVSSPLYMLFLLCYIYFTVFLCWKTT